MAFNLFSKIIMPFFKKGIVAIAASWLLMSYSMQASAHVNYIDLNATGSAGDVFSNWGWYAGTTTQLGNSHELAGGDFFSFHLDQASLVNITFSADNSSFNYGNYLDPAFSLYSGLLPNDGHDDAPSDPLNPSHLVPGVGVVKDPSPIDNGITSPFRDTAHITYNGQFDALHSWSMANESGDWGLINYITHVDPNNTASVSLNNYLLAPGDYTIAAAGGRNCDVNTCADPTYIPVSGLPGIVSFSATVAVPEPSELALLINGLLIIPVVKRKFNKA